jgi:hypothetical protein
MALRFESKGEASDRHRPSSTSARLHEPRLCILVEGAAGSASRARSHVVSRGGPKRTTSGKERMTTSHLPG